VQKLTIKERLSVLYSYLFRPKSLDEANFENFVLKRYGNRLYEYFFQPYTEKLFGVPGRDISVLWARQKVRLANPLDNLRENTKTKFQYFYYPIRGGYGSIANQLYGEIKLHVNLESKVTRIETSEAGITKIHYERAGEHIELPTQVVISTLPLTILTAMFGHPIKLQFRKVDAVYLLINKPNLSDYHWIYFIDSDVAINRMVEFKNMSPVDTPENCTVICAEVTQDHSDPTARVIDDLQRVGLIHQEDVLDTKHIREEFAYPVYTDNYEKSLQSAQQVLSQYHNLYAVGRAAEFRHREADDIMAAAMQVVDIVAQHHPGLVVKTVEEEHMTAAPSEPILYTVILTYNNYEDTEECLRSIQASNTLVRKIIVVDNGSSDQTPQKVKQDFPDVYVIENGQNLGVPAGYNVGFRYALEQGADYILMLNNDTVIAPDMIEKLLQQAESDPSTGIVMPKILYYGSNEQIWSSGGRYRSFPPAILMTDKRQKKIQSPVRMIEFAPSCGLLIHRRAFKKAGLFDPGYFFLFDDWDFSERVRTHGLNIWYVRDAVMWHKVSRTTKGPQSPLYWYTMGASIARYYRRHGRPAWLSLPAHVGFFILREFGLKYNRKFWKDFRSGLRDGMQKPLGNIPQIRKSSLE
jgi:GT2 family glycosyltransferase/UDP-galactopyranose mutase